MHPATASSPPSGSWSRLDEPRIVDLFAGPGGLDVAAQWLGIPAVGIEWDPDAVATRHASGLATIHDDVRNRGPQDPGLDANVLCGGPPCQTFTVAGAGSGRRALSKVRELAHRLAGERLLPREQLDELADVRTGLVLEPLRWIIEAKDAGRPYEAVVLEQVQTVRPLWDTYAEILREEGYAAETAVLRAEQYGVPQTRRRALLIARRLPATVAFPSASHQAFRRGVPAADPVSSGLEPWKSMGEALERDGFHVRSNYGTGGNPRDRGRRTAAEPSFTVTGKIGRNRVTGGGFARRFTHEEAGTLQTFPPGFTWRGRNIDQQIGNAIPPRLAAHVLDAVLGLGTDDLAYEEFVARRWRSPDRVESIGETDGSIRTVPAISPQLVG